MRAVSSRRAGGALAVGAVFASLAGCTLPSPPPETPAVPGPVELTVEEAADRYLDIVCMPNVRGAALEEAFEDGYPEYADGGAPDPAPVKEAAGEYAEAVTLAIEVIDAPGYVWPEAVTEWLPHIRSGYEKQLVGAEAITTAETYEAAYTVEWPERTAEEEAAGQEMRDGLGIETDPVESCEGRETALEDLHAEMLERSGSDG